VDEISLRGRKKRGEGDEPADTSSRLCHEFSAGTGIRWRVSWIDDTKERVARGVR